jgi:hypothetical protein
MVRCPFQRADAVDEKAVYGDYEPKVDSVSGVLKANEKKPLDAYLVAKGEVRVFSCEGCVALPQFESGVCRIHRMYRKSTAARSENRLGSPCPVVWTCPS